VIAMPMTRRALLAAMGGGATTAFLAACGFDRIATPSGAANDEPSLSEPSRSATTSPEPSPSPDLAGQAAAMLLVGFRGQELEPSTADDLARGLGGVVLFDRDQPTGGARNVESPGQLAALTAEIAARSGGRVTIAVDQEGGRVARLDDRYGFPPTRSAAELGAGDPAETESAARALAETLAAAGITLNLAPVVDLDVNHTNPIIGALDRSFSADPAVVAAHALAFVRGHHAAGILTALKHFPGHGSSTADTHLGIVDVSDTWSEREIEPFAALVDADEADAILTAHVFNARFDPDHPATLSHATITGLLREQLGYDGVVISDDLQMGAIRDSYGFEEAVRLAINAGVDVLTIANQQVYEADIVERTIDIIVRLVEAGEIDAARLEESSRRVERFRGRVAGFGRITG
jgi:beta-N-acetylhexosaminidase